MNHPTPFSTPGASMTDIEPVSGLGRRLRLQHISFCALVVVQLLAAALFARAYFDLVRTGAVSVPALLGTVLGSLCLYGATLLVAMGRSVGFTAFIAAAVLLILSIRGWGFDDTWSWVVALGAVLAALGAVLVRVMKANRSSIR